VDIDWIRRTRYAPIAISSEHGSEVLMAVTMKNAVFWNIKTEIVPHRKHITSPLQILAG
jgi:hypothetical protein